ncbi:hypothetical protein BDU57DRAFT_452247 [Ampelomyces quisqualis]|uniref:Uncharacterized protein n=1 Tax=Ampelomyces quisqualis TaxID=50730 RepID=A0A6A5QLD6_AMPQU|nr:hypothetical protein BDU57DRAFT_452247 [Ampelomyces quisqualis]
MPHPKSKPTVTVLPRGATLKPASANNPAPATATNKTRFECGCYPWDSHQSSIIVRSVELNYTPQEGGLKPLVGVEYYLRMLSKEKAYEHICTHFDEYRKTGADLEGKGNGEEDEGGGHVLRKKEEDEGVDYSIAPYPAATYEYPVYMTSTTNPALFLAIIRIAQHNLPTIDFRAAIAHLPNHPLDKPLPHLVKGKSPSSYPHKKGSNDTPMKLAFLPHFYQDGRHALGYFFNTPPFDCADSHNPPDYRQQKRLWMQTCLFTPCTTEDLEAYGMVEWKRRRGRKVWENIGSVGKHEGKWMSRDAAEEWKEWDEGVYAVGEVWERRMGRRKTVEGL